ncbi:unnamed protein product [Paramecium sonneborni]|uniref:B box-type domain-containing protein n=1 Tax=Paramecium sonneborni TaxID=65129 RepID=A0A8S1K131_9CILI|nr:unnamed protein product [Paramecium sonneborni]
MSDTSLGRKNKYYDQSDQNPELMDTSKFQQEKQQQQNQDQSSYRPQIQSQNLGYQQQIEQKWNDRATPYTFTVSNMPKISCFNHQGQTFTNFCKCRECFLPLCPECVKEHVYEHSEFKSYPKLECLENILNDVHKEVCQQGIIQQGINKVNQLVFAQTDISNSISQAYLYIQETVQKLKEAKQRILNIVEQYFHALEIELENQQNKNYDNFYNDGNSFNDVLNARLASHVNFLEKLKQPDCMYSLLPYLLSTTKEDNELYLKTAQQFSSRFKEASSLITFDSIKSSQLSAQIAQIVNVFHKDLPEFLDIHKLASPEIIQTKVLNVKSQNLQVSQINPYQNSKIQQNIVIPEKIEPLIKQQLPKLEQSYGYQQQQKVPLQQVPNQQIQNSLFNTSYTQQGYGQQNYRQQQPFQQAQLNQINKFQGYPQTPQTQPFVQPNYQNFNPQFSNQGYQSLRYY